MMDDYNDPAASETHDENMLREVVERWRNETRPEDCRPSNVVRGDAAEPYWVWRKR
jgi:hypothetical protein